EAIPADHMRAINNVLSALEQAWSPQQAVRCGETMHELFESLRYNPRQGERITDSIPRYAFTDVKKIVIRLFPHLHVLE
ncbi:unnamed protein product, partial [Prorocentrum cordatum]